MRPALCLRFDVDSRADVGALPRLLGTLTAHEASATVFVTTGRDLTRTQVLKRGVARFGSASVARYGTSLASMVVAPMDSVESGAAKALKGHSDDVEVSLHGLDHGRWCESAKDWDADQTSKALNEACGRFSRAFGTAARGFAPPCFATNGSLRGLLHERGFAYVSDSVVPDGGPELDGSSILSVPVTMRGFQELPRYPSSYGTLLGEEMVHQARRTGFSCAYFHPSLVVHNAPLAFESFLETVSRSGVQTASMGAVARESGLKP